MVIMKEDKMKRNKISKKMALIFSAAFICCSTTPNVTKTHAADTNGFQYNPNLMIKIQGEEAHNGSTEIPDGGYRDEVPEGYTPIRTTEDLYGISNNPEGNYILMTDIDLSGTKPGGDLDAGNGWNPIENFDGILDGNGYRIKNMHIYDSNNNMHDSIGFISRLYGTIKNLGLTNIDIHAEKEYSYIGGITGFVRGHISNCYVTGTIHAPMSKYTGGILGSNEAGDRIWDYSLTNCYADVDVYGGEYAGGITGFADSYYSPFEHCYALGTVTAAKNGTARPVNGRYKDYFSPNYYLVKNGTDDHATGLTDAQSKMAACYTGFDFNKTWVIDKNSPYPYPQLRNCMQVRTESIELLSPPDKLTYTENETLDFSGSKLKLNYEDGYSVEIPLNESIVSYKMEVGSQIVNISYNGKSAQFDIDIKPMPETLKVTAKKTKLKVGSSFTYKVSYSGNGTVTFTSSNSNVLRIDRTSGRASAKKAGKATVTIKGENIKKTIKVTVVKK